MVLKLANDFILLLFLYMNVCIWTVWTRKFRDWDERTLFAWVFSLCVSLSLFPFHLFKIYLFWHKDKSKAASASHNQIRAERIKLCNIMLIFFEKYCEWCSAPSPPPSKLQFACMRHACFLLWMHLNVCAAAAAAFNRDLTDRLIYIYK